MAKSKTTKTTTSSFSNNRTLFEKIEIWGANNEKKLLFSFLALSLFFSFMLFNARISEAHDDALYLEGGWRYVNEFPNYFYTQNAPLYVLFLGLLTKLFGFKLLLFKLFNVVFNLFSVFFFYKAFYKRIPFVVFIPVIVFISCNHLIQYYASMTFTEAFYLFLISIFLYTFFKLHDALQIDSNGLKHWKKWLLIGFLSLLISTTKSAGIVVVPSLLLYFFIIKQYKNGIISLVSYSVFKLTYELLVRLIWGAQNQFSAQGKTLIQKDPYDASLGNEDFAGFVTRVIDNCNLYFSKRFFQILGFRDENSVEIFGLLTILVIGILILSLYTVYKHNQKPLLFFGIFTGAQLLLSFIILAARWDQPRIVMICMPIMLSLMYFTLYTFLKKSGMGQNIYITTILIICISIITSSIKRSAKTLPIVQKNLKGDLYYGYTPDWENFLKCSKWCADSLPKNSLVASRKAPMSFVYGKGKKFFPVYSVIKRDSLTQQSNPDSALAYFEEKGVTHIMIGSLRIDPNHNTGQIINTVHNIVQPIMNKYPNKLKLIHTEGLSEPTYIFEITK